MGRELKRVPLNFAWPLNTVWDGYLNPHYHKCPACNGHGETPARQRLSSIVSLLLLSGEDSLRQHNHPYFRGANFDPGCIPTPEMATLTTGLAGRSPAGRMGHDAIDRWHATDAILMAGGCDPKTWGWCPDCQGSGIDTAHKTAYEVWVKTEPPDGDGYQVWETVTEGSPISPVFPSADTCVAWLIAQGYSPTAACNFVKSGWAPSLVMTNGKYYGDIESAVLHNDTEPRHV